MSPREDSAISTAIPGAKPQGGQGTDFGNGFFVVEPSWLIFLRLPISVSPCPWAQKKLKAHADELSSNGNHDMAHSKQPTSLTFADNLREVYESMRKDILLGKPTKEVYVKQNSLRFLCVWNGLKNQIRSSELRECLERLLGLKSFRMIQVVGDSNGAFSTKGLAESKNTLLSAIQDELCDSRRTVLEYGYTACLHDANWVVNDVIRSMPELGSRTIANTVYMSSTAVEKWGCEANILVCNFVLAYDEGDTDFGSDTWLSDSVMDATYNDQLICLEGGPQAFAQAVNVCLSGVSIVAVTGSQMRAHSNPAAPPRFSAADALKFLQSEVSKCANPKILSSHSTREIEMSFCRYLDCLLEFQRPDNAMKRDQIWMSAKALLSEPGCLQSITVKLVD